MTPHSMAGSLGALGRSLRRATLARNGLRWLGATLGLWLAWFWLDNLLRLPAGLRLAMLAAGAGWPLWRAWRDLVIPATRRVSTARTARELERRFGLRDNLLINACQFEGLEAPGLSGGLARQTVSAGTARAAAIAPRDLRDLRLTRRLGAAAVLAAAAWLAYALTLSHHAVNALARFGRPLADIPPVGALDVRLEPSGTVEVWEGDALTVTAELRHTADGRPAAAATPPRLRRTQRTRLAESSVDLAMVPAAAAPGRYTGSFEDVREPFTCRVFSGDTWSPATQVRVRRAPRLVQSSFTIQPPAYAALPAATNPGPPAAVTALAGSRLRVVVELDRDLARLQWQQGSNRVAAARDGRRRWRLVVPLDEAGDYRLLAQETPREEPRLLVRGAVALLPDAAPVVSFASDDRNRFLWPGEELVVPVEASDDHGLRAVWVTAAPAADATRAAVVAQWAYAGPPGRRGVAREGLALVLDAARFEAGESYRFEARARDWQPGDGVGRSVPLIVRMRRPQDAAERLSGALKATAEALEKAIAEQRRALGLTRNLEMHLDEALAAAHLPAHQQGIRAAQERARQHGRAARDALQEASESGVAARLGLLVEQEMGLALERVQLLAPGPAAAAVAARVTQLAEQQTWLLNELMALLGRLAAQHRAGQDAADGATAAPAATDEQRARDLAELLTDFVAVQKRIVEQSRTLLERGPEDLTEAELAILGELAREEARWAALLRDKLDDLAKNPLQDFADGSLAEEFNEIYQEVQKAAEALYARKIELAVPQEQSGLENAEELVHNLERWLTDKPDYQKWLMEEPPQMPDAPLAELPRELEDIVGELLDEEEAMTEEVEDVTSGWIDSLDKGAGWDAMDGPISSMGAKGVTGNQLPNQMEIGGRSGEGRTGRSQGQMVESAAEGKDGRQTPSRVTATPFETGSVDDQSQQSPGGASGGGKLAGFAGEGLRGPTPPPRLDRLQRLAGRQSEIRQDAERLNLHLRAHGVPAAGLEAAVGHMRELEAHAAAGRSGEIRRAFDATLESMRGLRATVAAEAGTRRERGALSREEAEALWTGLRDDLPPGYEEIVAAYYRRLAEEGKREP